MKKVISILFLVILFVNSSFAVASGYSDLNDLEKQIFSAFLVLSEDFVIPSSARISEMGLYESKEYYRNADPSSIEYKLARADTIVIKANDGSYYQLYLTDWSHPQEGPNARKEIEKGKALAALGLIDPKLYTIYYRYYSEVGYYEKLLSSSDSVMKMKTSPVVRANVDKINKALVEHWNK